MGLVGVVLVVGVGWCCRAVCGFGFARKGEGKYNRSSIAGKSICTIIVISSTKSSIRSIVIISSVSIP
jgi:hypothetical protein